MSRRALIEHRPWLLASMSAALLYYLVIDNPLVQIYPLEGIWLNTSHVWIFWAARRSG